MSALLVCERGEVADGRARAGVIVVGGGASAPGTLFACAGSAHDIPPLEVLRGQSSEFLEVRNFTPCGW
jgi:hypothetical protein